MSECIGGNSCGPEVIETAGRWCCFWCGFPMPLDELPERLGGKLT